MYPSPHVYYSSAWLLLQVLFCVSYASALENQFNKETAQLKCFLVLDLITYDAASSGYMEKSIKVNLEYEVLKVSFLPQDLN